MRAVLTRLIHEDARRLIALSLALAAWFALIMLVVRNAEGLITAKLDVAGSSMTKGFGIGGLATPDALIAQMTGVSFSHPLVLALVGAVSVAPGVRACQGELANGTLELTLAGPIARWRYLLACTVHAIFGVTLLMFISWASMVGFDRALGVPGSINPGRAFVTCAHAALVFCAFYAIALAASVWLARRGSAMFVAIGVLVTMFAITFTQRAWDNELLGTLSWASVFHGFDPGSTLLYNSLEVRDLLSPLLIAAVSLSLAFWKFERRDL